ncbi:MAG: malto-oligosyltrehalose trehalohydrolase, partial [Deltaproteobacteria bacterium]|nr:malto-oligosyltrehalose trehalohydrolase [Deltaproteobacteria bacterium]
MGPTKRDEHWEFLVWAPLAGRAELELEDPGGRVLPLVRRERGYWEATVAGLEAGARYRYRLDGGEGLPDPASSFQPLGIHGPSVLVDHDAFGWTDGSWRGLSLGRLILYEVHVGTFTREGTFDAVVPRLRELRDLGVTCLELMPVAQFPGERNWGYDGVNLFAVQASYGGPDGLKRLVDACHGVGLAVVLDVVMNHLGPEGNYLGRYGPYFTDRYRTLWGEAVNFDGVDSDEVRRFFLQNALHWFERYHVDGLRLDAVHAIHDESARPFLGELAEQVGRLGKTCGRPLHLVAESDRNDPRVVRPAEAGGLGLDALWLDDLHHALHSLLTGERAGYYADFGRLGQLAKCYREGFAYSGEYSTYHQRRQGASSRQLPGERFVVFAQNHDQVGNRRLGERLANLVPFEALKLAAGAVLLSPFVPLLFMGEEYGEEAPFLCFVDHGDPEL